MTNLPPQTRESDPSPESLRSSAQDLHSARQPHQTAQDVQALVASATAGLLPMFNESKQLFCDRTILSESGMMHQGLSPRYTLITLMGLHRLEQSGHPSPIAIQPSFDGLVRDASLINNAGDMGLLLWLCALVAPERIPEFLSRHDLEPALEKSPDARERRTMELSWILSGIAHAVFARPELRERLTPLAAKLYALLKENRGPAGAFGHQAATAGFASGIKGLLRGRLGSFADQVYPIYAFAWTSRAFAATSSNAAARDARFADALEIANACAENICRVQGGLGQWWWHYDSRTGEPVGKYPVYAVHQHAMGPLALFALMDAGGRDSTREIYLGLEYIYGANELRVDLRDAALQTVWRCIRPSKYRRYLEEALTMIKVRSNAPGKELPPSELHVLHECWPYELGWLIYAFSGRSIA
jgi:hypothetical protein